MDYEKVLIIGNGFDLNLGLKTRYADFMQSSDFTKLAREDSNLFSHITEQVNLNNWVDVEIELKNYSLHYNDHNFEKDYYELCDSLINYILNIDYTKINRSSSAYNLVKTILGTDFIAFDFNYTDTFSQIGKELNADLKDLENRIINVHGAAKENKIVFGVEDSAQIKREHIFLKKSFPLHYKAIGLSDQLKKAKEIHFFGHSLGETDHTYFKNFFSYASNENIGQHKRTIFLHYYDDHAYKELNIQMDELTSKTLAGFKQVNFFRPIKV